jgi:hypothetical protein
MHYLCLKAKLLKDKIMLMPSSLDKDKKWLKEESSMQAQSYSLVFYLSLEYRSPYYKEGCNMVILTKPKCSKPRRDSKSDERKPKFQSVLKSLLPVRQVLHTSQTGWTYSRASLVHRTCSVHSPVSREVF